LSPGIEEIASIGWNRFASADVLSGMSQYFQRFLMLVLFLSAGAADAQKTSTGDKPMQSSNKVEYATLGGGCFWCLEAVFERVEGVKSVISGYAGGIAANPSYEQVCTGTTGHAEVVQIEFYPAVVSFDSLLEVFWEAHDPTTMNRQGPDEGTQYRSIILYQDEQQRLAAERSRRNAAANFSATITTEIVPLKIFYRAEGYHQDYFRNNPNAPYCVFVIKPKLKKLDRTK
jgi:peptide-methionine (S)-S-oxide reductase